MTAAMLAIAELDPQDEPPAGAEPVAAPAVGTLYLDHRAKLTGGDRFDAALEVVGFAAAEGGDPMVIYVNHKDGTHHAVALAKWNEPVEALFPDGWRVVPRFVRISREADESGAAKPTC